MLTDGQTWTPDSMDDGDEEMQREAKRSRRGIEDTLSLSTLASAYAIFIVDDGGTDDG